MVSLGPLSPQKYCAYSCPFCYVDTDYNSFGSLPVPEIVDWVKDQQYDEEGKSRFDVVYVSGDTDSFAPWPRQEQGMQLLEGLAAVDDIDILFTTRAILTSANLARLEQVVQATEEKGRFVFGCVSVAQLSVPHIEPRPIAPPEQRMAQLRRFKELGAVSVLALRPFLPVVPHDDYARILNQSSDVDIVLGEVWYADQAGTLEQGVFKGDTPKSIPFTVEPMPFDGNPALWKVYEAKETEAFVRERCEELGLPFFMRSRPAIELIRQQRADKPY